MSAALAGASTLALAVGASALVADITGIASTATEQRNPRASTRLGWVSFAAGILSMGIGLFGNARGAGREALNKRYFAMEKMPEGQYCWEITLMIYLRHLYLSMITAKAPIQYSCSRHL